MFSRLLQMLSGKPTFSRAPGWSKLRAEHLKREPRCRACRTTIGLEVHHKVPVHIDPTKELDPMNLMTLCETNGCHFLFGHARDWRAFNGRVDLDVANVREMIDKRRYR